MKNTKRLMSAVRTMFILAFAFTMNACQKELNFDNLETTSVGVLKADSTLECLPSTVNGQYFADSILSVGNFIDLQVNVTVTGAYDIASDTINGYSFRGTGSFGNNGINIVRLYGTGKPLAGGTDQFSIYYGTSFCKVDVDVDSVAVEAQYSFGGAGAACTGAVLGGTYTSGVAMDASNTAEVDIQVTSPGTYSINTLPVNGVSFSGTGVFTDTTPNSVVLTAQGTPAAAGTFYFPLLGNGSSCSLSVTFQ